MQHLRVIALPSGGTFAGSSCSTSTTMLRRLPALLPSRSLSHLRRLSSSPTPSDDPLPPYSFLNPSLFPRPSPPQHQQPQEPPPPPQRPRAEASSGSALSSSLASAISSRDPDAAWLAFRSLAALPLPPSPDLSRDLIALLLLPPRQPQLRPRHRPPPPPPLPPPHPLPFPPSSLSALLRALPPSPALALPSLPPFASWGPLLLPLASSHPSLLLRLLSLLHRAVHSPAPPDLPALNAALSVCCRRSGSLHDADRVLAMMSASGVAPDAYSLASMAYLYAWRSVPARVAELEAVVHAWGFADRSTVYTGLVGGYIRCGDFTAARDCVLKVAREWRDAGGSEEWGGFGTEVYFGLVKLFVEGGRIRELATMVFDSQAVELTIKGLRIECSIAYGVINACVSLGWLDKAHSILDEMNAQGAALGIGVYSPILRAYCKDGRTAEAAQLVGQIRSAGLQIDRASCDSLIDASMAVQDFQSAFGIFRAMREAGFSDLKTSYLTIMTGLMENQRPELMAGFLDSIVGDQHVEVATHDWNSVIHAFCKTGRLEDAKRTYKRMVFLEFKPNEQTYLSLINGYVLAEKYFNALLLWNEVKRKSATNLSGSLVDAFLYAFVKGGFFDAALEVIDKVQQLKIFIDKWRYKHAFMENHKKLRTSRMRRRDFKKKEALIAFKNWAGLNA